jgi:simple sugar transport system permease protein
MRVRAAAVMLAGALAGLGGAYLALEAAQFVKNMSAGRGFIALAAVIFGKWRPLPAAAACLLFGLAEAFQIRLQGAGVPTQFVQMIPYVLTMVALAGFVGRSRPPASLGLPLPRER